VNPETDALPKVTAKSLRWKSKDGLEIEGVLRLPFDYQQGKRVPLLVELHGGPTGVALEGFPVSRTYPYQLFLQEGFAVLLQTFAAARITAASSGWRTSSHRVSATSTM
jgi:dipeptidyl aminopeptidase/acylaminoacyl peptidase